MKICRWWLSRPMANKCGDGLRRHLFNERRRHKLRRIDQDWRPRGLIGRGNDNLTSQFSIPRPISAPPPPALSAAARAQAPIATAAARRGRPGKPTVRRSRYARQLRVPIGQPFCDWQNTPLHQRISARDGPPSIEISIGPRRSSSPNDCPLKRTRHVALARVGHGWVTPDVGTDTCNRAGS